MSSSDDESASSFDDNISFIDSEEGEILPQVDVPKDIELKSVIVDICCHPKKNVIAAGTIDGPVHLYSFEKNSECKEILTFEHHKKSCRAVKYSQSGNYLFTASQDTTIYVVDLETNSVHRKFSRPDGSPIYSLLPVDDYFLAAGEDGGQVVIWDFRMQAPIACFEDCNDYISSLCVNKEKKILLATSGDGLLSAFNVRSGKMMAQSEAFDYELLSSAIFKDGSKVVVGDSDGSLDFFNWGEFGNISDRFPGHPGTVDVLAVVGDDVVCTGCEDGKIRAVQLFPNRFLGILGSHHGFPVEALSVSYDSSLVASSSYDQKIKFWDLSSIEDAKSEEAVDSKKG
ncbi:WD repeat-containing protein 55, partial [Stegodyphus mimosarum]